MEMGELTERLRDRIVTALHVGRLKGGDRLPGMREVAREMGANARTVARAYRQLEREGLLELRERSGVYVVQQDHWGGQLLEETGRWLGGILLEAWKRNIRIPDLAGLIRRCTRENHIRAVCVAENEDDRRAIYEELTQSFGIASDAIPLARILAAPGPRTSPARELRRADLIVTTPFHAGVVRASAERSGMPFVMIALHPDIVGAIEQRLETGSLTVVCADPAFGDQARVLYGRERQNRIRIILATDHAALAAVAPEEPVLLTRAAQERLPPDMQLTPLVPFVPFMAPDSARQILELMVRLHMEREHAA